MEHFVWGLLLSNLASAASYSTPTTSVSTKGSTSVNQTTSATTYRSSFFNQTTSLPTNEGTPIKLTTIGSTSSGISVDSTTSVAQSGDTATVNSITPSTMSGDRSVHQTTSSSTNSGASNGRSPSIATNESISLNQTTSISTSDSKSVQRTPSTITDKGTQVNRTTSAIINEGMSINNTASASYQGGPSNNRTASPITRGGTSPNRTTSIATNSTSFDPTKAANFIDCESYSSAHHLTPVLFPDPTPSANPATVPFEEYWCAHWAFQWATAPHAYPGPGGGDPYFYNLTETEKSFCMSIEKENYTSWAAGNPPLSTVEGSYSYTKENLWFPHLTPPCCPTACDLSATAAQLLYWPTPAPEPKVTSFVSNGRTFISPSVYVIFKDIAVTGACGPIGPQHTTVTMGFDPSDVKSYGSDAQYEMKLDTIDYAQLWSNCTGTEANPTQVLIDEPPCETQTNSDGSSCQAQESRYLFSRAQDRIHCHPYLSYPPGLLEADSAWKTCADWPDGGHSVLLFDPPRTLAPATAMVPAPTQDPNRSRSASPASSPSDPGPSKTALPSVSPAVSQAGDRLPPTLVNSVPSHNDPNQNPPDGSPGSSSPSKSDPNKPPSNPDPASPAPSQNDPNQAPDQAPPNENPVDQAPKNNDPNEGPSNPGPTNPVPSANDPDKSPSDPNPVLPQNNPNEASPGPNSGNPAAFQNNPTKVPSDPDSVYQPPAQNFPSEAPPKFNPADPELPKITAAANPPNGHTIGPRPSKDPFDPNLQSGNEPSKDPLASPPYQGFSAQPPTPSSPANAPVNDPSMPDPPSFEPNQVNPAPVATPFITTIEGYEFQAPASPNVLFVGGQSIAPGANPALISGTPIALQSNGDLIIGPSTIQNIFPIPSPAPPVSTFSVGTEVLTLSSNNVIAGGRTIARNDPALTVAGTPVSLGPSALHIGASAMPLPAPGPSPSPALLVTAAGQTYPVSQISNGIVVAGLTIVPDQPAITISGTPIQALGSSAVVIGTNTIPLVPTPRQTVQNPIVTVAGQANPVTPVSNGIIIAGSTILPNQPAVTISGTPVQALGNSAVMIGTSTIPIVPTPTPPATAQNSILTVAGQAYPITPVSNDIVIAGSTIHPNQPGITISGTPVQALGSSAIVIGSSTITLASPNASPIVTATLGGQNFPLTQLPNNNGVLIAGSTFHPGDSATISGTPIQPLGTSALLIGTSTAPLPSQPSPRILTETAAGGGQTYPLTQIPDGNNNILIAGSTLRPDGSAITISGTPIRELGTSAVVIGSSTVNLASLATSEGQGIADLVSAGLNGGPVQETSSSSSSAAAATGSASESGAPAPVDGAGASGGAKAISGGRKRVVMGRRMLVVTMMIIGVMILMV